MVNSTNDVVFIWVTLDGATRGASFVDKPRVACPCIAHVVHDLGVFDTVSECDRRTDGHNWSILISRSAHSFQSRQRVILMGQWVMGHGHMGQQTWMGHVGHGSVP